MRVLVQRSLSSFVKVNDKVVGEIPFGLVLFVGFTYGDTSSDIDYLVDKIIHLRIFDDEDGIMNKSILDIGGNILSVSQFTLYADAKKGRRPSYVHALNGKEAIRLYEEFNQKLKEKVGVQTGIFGEDMLVSIQNDGPVTILLESRSDNDKK